MTEDHFPETEDKDLLRAFEHSMDLGDFDRARPIAKEMRRRGILLPDYLADYSDVMIDLEI
jgi:hypothetical protein